MQQCLVPGAVTDTSVFTGGDRQGHRGLRDVGGVLHGQDPGS